MIKNMFKTSKKPTKNHVDSCYYAILLIKFFSVKVHSWEIRINLGSVVYSRANDALTFTLSKFLMAIVFRLANYQKQTPTEVFSSDYCKIFRTTTLKNIWERLLMNIVLPSPHFNNNIVVLTSSFQRHFIN